MVTNIIDGELFAPSGNFSRQSGKIDTMSLGYLPGFLHSQFLVTPPVPTQDCTGKTIVITGANTGLGKEAARRYVRLNCEKLVIACRSVEKGEAAKQEIESSTGRRGVIEVWPVDLQSYDSVKEFCKRVKTLKRLDILVENAGVATGKYYNVGGNESTITVNVISTFLMALLLLPKLQQVWISLRAEDKLLGYQGTA